MLMSTAPGVPRFSIMSDRRSSSTRFSSFPKFARARRAETTMVPFLPVVVGVVDVNSPFQLTELYSVPEGKGPGNTGGSTSLTALLLRAPRSLDGAEHGVVCRRVKRTRTNLQGWLQRESRGIFQPGLVVFEGGAFLVLARTSPQTPHQVRDAVEIHVYESLSVHHLSFVRFGLRATRIRCGRFSSSSCRPTGSFFGAARSPSRSAMPNTKRTVAYNPIATPGSPFSILTRVVRLIEARCAAMATGMRRRRRASRMSRPSLRSACLTGSGITMDDRLVLIFNVHNNGR